MLHPPLLSLSCPSDHSSSTWWCPWQTSPRCQKSPLQETQKTFNIHNLKHGSQNYQWEWKKIYVLLVLKHSVDWPLSKPQTSSRFRRSSDLKLYFTWLSFWQLCRSWHALQCIHSQKENALNSGVDCIWRAGNETQFLQNCSPHL